MTCEATKTYWIKRAREDGAAGIILYISADDECKCLVVSHSSNMSKKYDQLLEEGCIVLEEIFIQQEK